MEHNLKTIIIPLNPIYYACLDQACIYFFSVYYFFSKVFNEYVQCVKSIE